MGVGLGALYQMKEYPRQDCCWISVGVLVTDVVRLFDLSCWLRSWSNGLMVLEAAARTLPVGNS